MSLASPLSVGDAILLANIAYKVGRAFSSGAKSAPAEFAEVQSLLFSTGDALSLAGSLLKEWTVQGVTEETDSRLGGILKNCHTLLKSLEHFIEKYSILDDSQVAGLHVNGARIWKKEILKNFKKLAWTTEGEGIVQLKQTLTAHVQALNLALTAVNGKTQAATNENVSDTREHVKAMRVKLDELHKWCEETLRPEQQRHGSPRSRHDSSRSQEPGSFSLYEERENDGEIQALVCAHARVQNIWNNGSGSQTAIPRQKIFKCCCPAETHCHNLEYTLLPFSLLVQVISMKDNVRYQVYVRSPVSNTPVSLLLEAIEPRDISIIEDWADQAALYSLAQHPSNRISTYFVQADHDAISVLRMKANSVKYTGRLLNVSFRTTKGAFSVGGFSTIQILQYGTAWQPDRLPGCSLAALFPQPHVNVVLNCLADESQAQKCFTIRVNRNTSVSVTGRPRYIEFDDAVCSQEKVILGSQDSKPSDSVECSKITLEFSDASDAREFHADLQDAKKKLQIQYLQEVRWGDKFIGQLDIPDELVIRNLILQDVLLKVILEQTTDTLRMALVRRDHSASVTFELPSEFINDLSNGKESGYKDYLAWFVDIRKHRTTIIKQQSGMDPLAALSNAFQNANTGNKQTQIEDFDES